MGLWQRRPPEPMPEPLPAHRFKLITLDLDETLWPCEPVIRAAERAVFDWLNASDPRICETEDAASLRARRARLMEERPEIAHDVTEVRRVSIELLLEDLGHEPESAAQLARGAMDVFLEFRNRIEPFADVEPALRALTQRFNLISLTNGNADPEQTALRGLFDHHVTAARAGAAKPDPGVFELALRLAECEADECLHLGDEPYLDVQAARGLGIEAVWVNRYARTWPDDLQPPVLEIADLRQLVDWLDGRSL